MTKRVHAKSTRNRKATRPKASATGKTHKKPRARRGRKPGDNLSPGMPSVAAAIDCTKTIAETESERPPNMIDVAMRMIRRYQIGIIEALIMKELRIGVVVRSLLFETTDDNNYGAIHEVALRLGIGEATLRQLMARAMAFDFDEVKKAIVNAVESGYALDGKILDACAEASSPVERARLLSSAVRYHMSAQAIRTEIGVSLAYQG